MNNIIEFMAKKPHTKSPERIYVLSEQKDHIKALTGKDTLTEGHVKALKALGFIFKQRMHQIAVANIVRRFTAASKE